MAILTSGKTINQLTRIETVTGQELIPISVQDPETSLYRTCCITLDNFLQMVNIRLAYIDNKTDKNAATISEVATTAYQGIVNVNAKTEANTSYITQKASELNGAIGTVSSYVSYNASAIVRLGGDVHNIAYNQGQTVTYLTEVTYALQELTTYTNDLSAYTHAEFANNDMVDSLQTAYIAYNYRYDDVQQTEIEGNKQRLDNPWTTLVEDNASLFTVLD